MKELNAQIEKLGIDASIKRQGFFCQPSLQLYLLSGNLEQNFTAEQAEAIAEIAPMWSLIWSGGSALAKYILENRHLVAGKTIVDFAAGSGIVGLAALFSGAKKVYFCDLDSNALEAINANAKLNNFFRTSYELVADIEKLKFLKESDSLADILFAGDVLYDADNGKLIDNFLYIAKSVILAESHSVLKARANFKHKGSIYIDMQPNLDQVHRLVNIWQATSK